MRFVVLQLLCCCFLLFATSQVFSKAATVGGVAKCKPRLLLVSYDAFRPEYLTRNITPNAVELMKHGVHARRLHNVFPTKTFTNHFSVVTGVYPETHGITANTLYDPELGRLKYGAKLFHYNPNIMPIWTLNELSGGTSGCMMWPGSDFEYHNLTCSYNMSYDQSMPFKNRVDTVMEWFTDPKKPANFAVLYVEQPDKIGHQIGPDDPKINELVKKVDWITGYIQERLKVNNLTDCTDVIHISDHGMIAITAEFFLDFSPFLENGTYSTYGTTPVLQVVPVNDDLIPDIYERLLNASEKLGHFQVYKQPDLPERWHVRTQRFGPIVVVADLGYGFQDMYNSSIYYQNKYNITPSPTTKYGTHGYDNKYKEMSGYLIAKGPSFKQAFVVDEFDVIDLYNLFVKILDLPNPMPTNGSDEKVKVLLVDETQSVPVIGIIIGAIFIFLAVIAIITLIIYRRKRSYFMWW